MGELLIIVVGMSVGGAGACLLLSFVPDLLLQLRVLGGVVGVVLGALGGYAVAWATKRPAMPAAHVPPQRFARQVVGGNCKKCGERMLMLTDGAPCPRCDCIFCIHCEPELPCADCRNLDPAEVSEG